MNPVCRSLSLKNVGVRTVKKFSGCLAGSPVLIGSFLRVPEFTCQVAGCCQVFAALEDYQHHYHMMHRNACSLCSRAFPSEHLLDAHILEWHDSLFQILAERQDMVCGGSSLGTCMVGGRPRVVMHCPFQYQCLVEGCTEKFKTTQDRKDHMVRLHLYPADFRFDKPKTNRG